MNFHFLTAVHTFTDAEQAAQDLIEEANLLIETIQGFVPQLIAFGFKLLGALVIFVIGRLLIKLALKFLDRLNSRSKVDESVAKFLRSLCKAVLYILLLIVICSQIGIETTSIIAIFTSASLAIGLALQGALSNFAGGIIILIIRPFKVGDYVVADSVEGKVEQIDLFYTRLITIDNRLVLVPNGEMADSVITNVTAFEKRRVDLEFQIGYPDDISEARNVILSAVSGCEQILPEEEIQVVVGELGAHGITIKTRVWVKTEDYWTAYFYLEEAVKKALQDNGINIPYNQLDVHIVEGKQGDS